MKKLNVLLVILTLAFLAANTAQSKTIVSYTKVGGGLFGYKNVSSQFMGIDANGDSHWSVECGKHGWNKCKLKLLGISNPSSGVYDEILSKVDLKIDEMMAEVDLKKAQGKKHGSRGGKVVVMKDNGDHALVAIRMRWTHNTSKDETMLTFIVDEVGKPSILGM